MTAYNASANDAALAPLYADMGRLDRFLDREAPGANGMMWIGPAGTFTPLHHDLTNNLIAQIVGRKHVKLIPASEVGKMYNNVAVFSDIGNLDDPSIDGSRFPRLEGLKMYDIVLNLGELLYIPIGWWHQVASLDFSITSTYTNFIWPNVGHERYPAD